MQGLGAGFLRVSQSQQLALRDTPVLPHGSYTQCHQTAGLSSQSESRSSWERVWLLKMASSLKISKTDVRQFATSGTDHKC